MARSDWDYVSLQKNLMKEVDKAIKATFFHGAPKYVDRRDFIRKAIQEKIDRDLKKMEVPAS